MDDVIDYFALAQRSTREEFVAAGSPYFLVALKPVSPGRRERVLTPPTELRAASSLEDLAATVDFDELAQLLAESTPTVNEDSGDLADVVLNPVFPLVKRDSVVPGVAVGRVAAVADVVIPHPSVSRLHAVFRVQDDHVEVADAGSRNGSWIGGRRLVARGPFQMVIPGDVLRFAQLTFEFHDAAGCWQALQPRRP